MSGKKKESRVFLFNFASGYPRWYYRIPRADYPGVYDPRFYDTRFSEDDAVGQETWPDQGVDLGKAPSTMFGQRLGQDMLDLLPKTILVGGFADNPFDEYLRDINVTTDGEFNVHRLVSRRLKDIIEDLEPGVHQFTPVRFVNYVTRAPIWTDIPWYILNITTWIAPDVMFDCEAMALRFRLSEPYGHFPGETVMSFPLWFHSKKYVVRRSAIRSDIGARHLWVTNWYFKAVNRRVNIQPAAFCSDTFRSACMAAGLKGGRFIKLAMAEDDGGAAQASSPRGGSFGALP